MLFVIGPESISFPVPVISFDQPPFVVLENILVHGQDVTPASSFSLSNNTLGLSVCAPDGGNMAFDIPRSLLDAKDGTNDIPFRILFDGQPSQFTENIEEVTRPQGSTGNGSDISRSLDFYVPENTKTATIVGTQSIE